MTKITYRTKLFSLLLITATLVIAKYAIAKRPEKTGDIIHDNTIPLTPPT